MVVRCKRPLRHYRYFIVLGEPNKSYQYGYKVPVVEGKVPGTGTRTGYLVWNLVLYRVPVP